jgi:phosphohistidine phosphatase
MGTLVLLRHGKSAYPDGVDDHDRPLNERGRHQAAIAGRLLSALLVRDGKVLDLALVSSATRAQETWTLAAQHVVAAVEETRPDLYLADPDELTDIVRALPASADCVLLVGHNNGLQDVASSLTATHVTLKTSTFAVLAAEAPWKSWGDDRVDLREVVIAR